MTLFIVPQLPVKGRYQEYWIFWWMEELDRLGVDYEFILPENQAVEKLAVDFKPSEKEYFAPVPESISWDGLIASRLGHMLKRMSRKDVILFLDFDFTGIFQGLAPLIKRYKPELKLAAYVHAGSWAPRDYFQEVRSGKKLIELGTAIILDNLFFPSMSALMDAIHGMCVEAGVFDCGNALKSKSHVVGSLWKPYRQIIEVRKRKEELIFREKWLKESQVVLINSRYDSLNHELLRQVIEKLRGKVTFVATDKRVAKMYEIVHMNYFEALSVAKVMLQPKAYDTFGLAIVEAIYSLTHPVLPKHRVYEELYPKYIVERNSVEDWIETIEHILDNYDKFIEAMKLDYELIRKTKLSAPKRICKVLGLLEV